MKFLNRYTLAVVLATSFLAAGCGDNTGEPYPNSGPAPGSGGTIRGRVTLKGDAPKPVTDNIAQDQKTCGSSVSLPRIALGKDNGVQGTFVILEGVESAGTSVPTPTTQSVLIDQKECQYVPHTMIVPLKSKIEIINSDPILHNVNGRQGETKVFNYAQARQGQRETVDITMVKPGMITLACDAGHPWMSAFIYVATHPYVALTDTNGEFVIKDVPPGTYTLKMWHEGVTLKDINRKLQIYNYEDPYESTQQVTVAANTEATANFELALRQ
ncbi:MAG TPA: carboxypeptidase regulatory-like domain-containing protein [Terriglobia bacterium]|nr:carboxypeptidase regulatory-like domain-containing protein [Terriglobia bacterium]